MSVPFTHHTVAVSGLHRGENPQPGSGIIRSLRRRHPHLRVIGLGYDTRESGIYAEDGPDVTHLLPYPVAGGETFLRRLDAIREQSPFEIFIPTLDSEIEVVCNLQSEFARRGIRTCLPDHPTFRRRSKEFLPLLAAAAGVAVPKTRLANDLAGAVRAVEELTFPFFIKGPHYDARLVRDRLQLHAAATHLLAEWGRPVIMQDRVEGNEYNVLGLGDGEGGWFGHCCIRKTHLSPSGKGLGGVVVSDARLSELCARLIRELRWPGPFEIELIRDDATGHFVLIEINPRFPAWIDFPAMIGANFAATLVDSLTPGATPEPLPACAPGAFYLRHQIEVVGHVDEYADLMAGAVLDKPRVAVTAPAIASS